MGVRPPLPAWRFVVVFGIVSLLADAVYEGARSITGPLLASLGASAALVGLVTGAGEAAALVLRLVSGPLADHTGRFWGLTVAGYAVTVLAVPLLGIADALWVGCALVIAERVGKAIRGPAKDTLLSHATSVTGRGKGFAVHEALDQFGALLGPLLVAAVLAVNASYRPALLILAVPGALMMILLVWLRGRVPRPVEYEDTTEIPETRAGNGSGRAGDSRGLPAAFWRYAAFSALTMCGFATFGVLSFHLATADVVPVVAIPLVYAAAMGVDAVAALATGYCYDRYGRRVIAVLPVLAAAVPVFAFSEHPTVAVTGVMLWGAAVGVQESTMRAAVADLVPAGRRATGYGIFAAAYGGAAVVGGVLAGVLYSRSVLTLIGVTVAVQAVALLLLVPRRATGQRRTMA